MNLFRRWRLKRQPRPPTTEALLHSENVLLTPGLEKKTTWPNPEASIGLRSINIDGRQCWEVRGPALAAMESLSGKVQNLLNSNQELPNKSDPKACTVSFNMWMIGYEPKGAEPTVVFSSRSASQRAAAKTLLKDSKLLDPYPGVKIKTLDRIPAVYHVKDFSRANFDEKMENDIFVMDSTRGPCGSSITVGDQRHATLGGIITINGLYYGVSAQHIRYKIQVEDGESVPLRFDEDSDTEADDFVQITSQQSISSMSEPDSSNDPISSSESSMISGRLDTLKTSIGTSVKSTNKLHAGPRPRRGYRLASLSRESKTTDLDYEVFLIENPSFHTPNRIDLQKGRGYPTTYLTSEKVVVNINEFFGDATARPILAATGTTGVVEGDIIRSPYLIKMNRSNSFQEMWAVRLSRDSMPGDCGTWVVDARNGDILGHIVAGDNLTGLTYIIPACRVFDDLEERFQSRPLLPKPQPQELAESSRVVQSSSSTNPDSRNSSMKLENPEATSSLEETTVADFNDRATRPHLTQEQIAVLEDKFKAQPKPQTGFKKELAAQIGLSLQRVNVRRCLLQYPQLLTEGQNWYQNHRAKARNQRPPQQHFDVLPSDGCVSSLATDFAMANFEDEVPVAFHSGGETKEHREMVRVSKMAEPREAKFEQRGERTLASTTEAEKWKRRREQRIEEIRTIETEMWKRHQREREREQRIEELRTMETEKWKRRREQRIEEIRTFETEMWKRHQRQREREQRIEELRTMETEKWKRDREQRFEESKAEDEEHRRLNRQLRLVEPENVGVHASGTTDPLQLDNMAATLSRTEAQPDNFQRGANSRIVIHLSNGGIAQRMCKLDTASAFDVVSHQMVRLLGLKMSPYSGFDIPGSSGMVRPIGTVNLDWHVAGRSVTYTTSFIVLDGFNLVNYDVLLGNATIESIGFFKMVERPGRVRLAQESKWTRNMLTSTSIQQRRLASGPSEVYNEAVKTV